MILEQRLLSLLLRVGTVKLPDRQVTGWHEKSVGGRLEHIEFIFLLSFCCILGIIVVFQFY